MNLRNSWLDIAVVLPIKRFTFKINSLSMVLLELEQLFGSIL